MRTDLTGIWNPRFNVRSERLCVEVLMGGIVHADLTLSSSDSINAKFSLAARYNGQ